MELSGKNKAQWGLLLLLIVGVFVYRSLATATADPPTPEQLQGMQEEMGHFWNRIPSYPGSKAPKPVVDARPDRILWERAQPATASYAEAREFYDRELPWIGWQMVGEQRAVPGFTSPVYVYRSGNYHLFLTTGPDGILLRMAWNLQSDLLVEARIPK